MDVVPCWGCVKLKKNDKKFVSTNVCVSDRKQFSPRQSAGPESRLHLTMKERIDKESVKIIRNSEKISSRPSETEMRKINI